MGSMGMEIHENNQDKQLWALENAQLFTQQIKLTRKWNSEHGGVYVKLHEGMKQLHDYDEIIQTNDGQRLVRVNPASMTRQLSDLSQRGESYNIHITSLYPQYKGNSPYDWEIPWLRAFEQGEEAMGAFVEFENQEHFRYMIPLETQAHCLPCHTNQGYEVGEVMGGISITIPIHYEDRFWRVVVMHLMGGLIGVLALLWFMRSLAANRQQLINANSQLNFQIRQNQTIFDHLQLMQHSVEHSANGVFWIDEEGNLIYTNEQASKITGFSTKVLKSMKIQDLDPQLEDEEWKAIWNLVHTQKQASLERCFHHQKYSQVYVEIQASLLRNEDTDLVCAFIWDITDRKRTVEQLIDSEQRYQSIFNNNHAVMLVLSPENGKIIDGNPAACNFYGYTRDELRAMSIFQINMLSKEELKLELELVKKEDRKYFNFKHRLSNGDIRDVEVYSGPIFIQDKEYFYSIVHDITERNRAQQELRESEQRYRQLIENSPETILVKTRDNVVYINQAGLKLFGVSTLKEFQSKNMFEWFHQQFHERILEEFKQSIMDNTLVPLREELIITSKGNLVEVEVVRAPIMFRGQPALQTIIRDISAKRRAEEHKAHLENQLRQSQKMEAIGVLAGGIAHDFNNILQGINIGTELALSTKNLSAAAIKQLDNVLQLCNRGSELVRQILTFSRKDDQPIRPVQISPTVREALRMLRSSMSKNIQFKAVIAHKTQTIRANPTQIYQLITNLCTNSEYSMRQSGGVLEVTLQDLKVTPENAHMLKKPEGNYVVLTVKDAGCGIPEAQLERVFEPFFTTKPTGEGTGLGLSMVHGIVESHDGLIDLHSEVGLGTTITVYFPALLERPEVEPPKPVQALLGDEMLLLVDDEAMLVTMLDEMLRSVGYQVFSTTNPKEALKKFQQSPNDFDLLITDYSMHDMNGDQLAAEIHKTRPELPCILITGLQILNQTSLLEQGHLKAIYQKPLDVKKLCQAIRQILNSDPLKG